MKVRGVLAVVVAASVGVVMEGARAQQSPTTAKVETIPLELTAPDRYFLPVPLEPIRRVTLMATADGVLRTMEAQVGASVRDGQEVAQLDRNETAARLRIAQADVKEHQAAVASGTTNKAQLEARLEAARARADLAQLELDHCTLRAPFGGKLLAAPVFEGQFVTKGSTIAELADVSNLRALVPLNRATATVGGTVTVSVEGQPVEAKIKALLPLPESFGTLRQLAAPFAAAWVVIANPKNEFEPGQRVVSPALPTSPLAIIPARAVQTAENDKDTPIVQLIRNEYVTNVKVHVLGHPGPDRVQISGPLRPTDALIVSTSVPLLAGTLIRFSGAAPSTIEGTNPNPAEGGALADIALPRSGTTPAGRAATAPPKPRATTAPATSPVKPATPKAAGNAVPF